MCSTLSLVDSDSVLGLIEVGDGGEVKISLPNLLNYFSESGDFKQKKIPTKKWYFDHNWVGLGGRPLCGGHHPKVQLFLTPPLIFT